MNEASDSHVPVSAVPPVAPRVLSIQSSVVYGIVGNKASVFPLQLLGFETDPINSCQLSNHTGYSLFTGRKANGEEIASLADGLERNGFLCQYSHVLTGYMSSVSFLEETATLIGKMKKANPKLVFVCDPVLGDDGRLYMPKEFIPIYRDRMLPMASVLTPNQTEAAALTGLPIDTLADAVLACSRLHEWGIPTVVITSLALTSDFIDVLATTIDPALLERAEREGEGRGEQKAGLKGESDVKAEAESCCILRDAVAEASSRGARPPSRVLVLHIRIPRLPQYYSGTGDLASALVLAWLHMDSSLRVALEKTMGSIAAILRATVKAGRRELALIQSSDCLRDPPRTFSAAVAVLEPAPQDAEAAAR